MELPTTSPYQDYPDDGSRFTVETSVHYNSTYYGNSSLGLQSRMTLGQAV